MTANLPPRSPSREDPRSPRDRITSVPLETMHRRPSERSSESLRQGQAPQEGMVDPEGEENALLSRGNSRASKHEVERDNADKATDIPAVTLHRSSYIVWMVSIYASLALTAWILICLLTVKPLTTRHYGFDTRIMSGHHLKAQYAKSEEIYKAARTVQAIVGVLTIPLTSAVCSAAAVVFAQYQRSERRLTMRQMVTLADKGWTDPTTITRMLTGRGKKISSSLLIWALLLNLLGASIVPLQSVLLSQKTIKTPTYGSYLDRRTSGIVDIPGQLDPYGQLNYNSMPTLLTQNALKSTSNTTPQPRLWQEGANCSLSDRGITEQCAYQTTTFGNFSKLSSPYLAQLPVGFHTGLIKQFIPRINSTVRWESVSPEDMPIDCGEIPNAFYAHYANATWPPESDWHLIGQYPKNWSIEACMPSDLSASPWRNTYSRQNFTEQLYLNISVIGYGDQLESLDIIKPNTPKSGGIFRITSETTAGYFELPNYMNGGKAGPVIEGDPNDAENCGHDCTRQSYVSPPKRRMVPRIVPPVSNFESNGSLNLATVANKGPLLTVAIALFGRGSFIPDRLNNQETFIRDYDSLPKANGGSTGQWVDWALVCVDQMPLSSLLRDPDDAASKDCIRDTIQSASQLDDQIVDYLQSLYLPTPFARGGPQHPERSENAFAAAVFLANEAWLTYDVLDADRFVTSDSGSDTVIPAISTAGMAIVSALWVVFIASLFALAIYSARTPRWTHQLDAFAMMRVGATTHDCIALEVAFETRTIDALDDLPGLVGDATGGEGEVGVLGMGAGAPLNGVRRYRCCKGDEVQATRRAAARAYDR